MSKGNVLITGGTGLVGTRLTELLIGEGYQVAYLSRSSGQVNGIQKYVWNVEDKVIDRKALEWADYIVNLAGASVAGGRWTKTFKKEIYDSRIRSTRLLFEYLEREDYGIRAFVSASAIGIYKSGEAGPVDEYGRRGDDFLAAVTKDWECEVQNVEALNIRCVMLRIGVVLSTRGGALPQLMLPIKLWAGAPLGSGNQWMSWIHIDDLCHMFIRSLEDEKMEDAYNAVAPNPVTNKGMTKAIATVLRKPLWLPKVPGFVLKLLLGEMAQVVLEGHQISAKKIEEQGFTFQFSELNAALKDLLK